MELWTVEVTGRWTASDIFVLAQKLKPTKVFGCAQDALRCRFTPTSSLLLPGYGTQGGAISVFAVDTGDWAD